jgi:hypothetical protein
VISPQEAAVLEGALGREARSLLQYVHDAFPWVRAGTDEGLRRLQQAAREQQEAVAALARSLSRQHYTVGPLAPYPMDFTTMNYVSLGHLLPLLAGDERRGIAALERDRAALSSAEARAEADKLLALKRRHLQTLEAPAAAPAAAAH